MKCPKTSRCACPGVRCMIPAGCRGKTKAPSSCSQRKPSRKVSNSRRKFRKSCSSGKVRNSSTGRCRLKKSSKPSKSRRKPSCGPGKVRNRSTGRCRMISRRKPSRKADKSRRKTSKFPKPRKASKSRRKSSCGPGKVRNRSTGRCRMISRRKPSRKLAKSRRIVKSKSRRTKSISSGWSKLSPNASQRTTMLKKCGKKCFLGPKKSFPICAKKTCKVNAKGLHAAYVRSKQLSGSHKKYKGKTQPIMTQSTYQKIARSAKAHLARRGYKVGN